MVIFFAELKDQITEPGRNAEFSDGSVFEDPCKAALEKEVSPVKDKLLTTFAQLTPGGPSSGTPGTTSTEPSEDSSWLTNVKGKLAKTVDNSLEKYQEIKAEREKAKLRKGSEASLSLDFEEEPLTERRLSHSLSEISFHESMRQSKEAVSPRPQSQIFEFDPMLEPEKEIVVSDKTPAQDIPGKGGSSADTPLCSTPSTETPTKTRRRFANLFSRTSTTPSSATACGSPGKEEVKLETPRRGVRALLRDYVGKPSTPSESGAESDNTKCFLD